MNWTLRKKILGGYGIVLLLFIGAFGLAISNLQQLGRASDAILSENYRSIRAADNMINALERQDSGVLLHILGFKQEGLQQFQQYQTTFVKQLARAEGNVTIEGEGALIRKIDSSYTAYVGKFMDAFQQSETLPAEYHEVLLPAFLDVRGLSDSLRTLNQETMVRASDRAAGVANRAIWSMGIFGLVGLGLALAFSLVLSNRIVRPVQQVRAAAERVAAGDYDVDVQVQTRDELGNLAKQFNEMTAQLQAYRDLNIEKIMAEKRKNEAIIHNIDDGLVVMNEQFMIEDLNPAAEHALDVRRSEAADTHFLEIVPNEQLFEHVKQVTRSSEKAFSPDEQQYLSVTRNGEPRHYQYVTTPVSSSSDEMLGVILLLRDVTELKELDRMKSEFVANASHELKTPLTSLEMSLGLLGERSDALTSDDRELLAVADEETNRLRSLVADLLDLSKIESGSLELDLTIVAVSLLLEKARENFELQADEQEIALSSDVAEELPRVVADPTKITWVLTNLISNALRYTDPGGHIELWATEVKSTVQITVTDDGAGIPYEYQGKIFDKFVQVEGEESASGTGLGLAICQEMVHAHGGRIWVESTPGEGSSFTFTLPLAR